MLSPSDFNNAVPQFTNGNYASNPINPQYIAEPDAVSYNRGTEPLQTLPAQWWNWFLNKFTGRFNKVNIYVKNIFNELAQVLSIFEMTPDGTEQTPTTSQLKTVFECCYPQYVKTTANLASASTTVNGHPLSSDVTVTRSDLGLGTSATVNTGTAAGCIPTVGTALGTTNNNILVTDASGNLKPSGITVGTAASCDATAFRPSTWTPTVVCCAKCNGSGVAFGSAATCDATAFRASTWTPTCVACACYIYHDSFTGNADRNVMIANEAGAGIYGCIGTSQKCPLTFNPATGEVKAKTFTGTLAGCACCAGQSYCVMDYCSNTTPLYVGYASTGLTCAQVTHLAAFSTNYVSGKTVIKDASKDVIKSWLGLGTAAACAATCFRASNWTPTYVNCAKDLYKRPDTNEVLTCCICFLTGCANGSSSGLKYITTYINGSNGYYYGNICGNVCGTASSANYASRADTATSACYAYCHYYTSLLKICHECQACSSCFYCCGRLFLCNTASYPVRPILLPDAQYYNPPSSEGEFAKCITEAIRCTYPWLFCDHIEFCTLRDFLGVPNRYDTCCKSRPPLVLQANQKLYLASSNIYWCCAACDCKVLGCAFPGVGYY